MTQVFTAFYVAPEVRSGRFNEKVDVYSFGKLIEVFNIFYSIHLRIQQIWTCAKTFEQKKFLEDIRNRCISIDPIDLIFL